MPVFGQIRSQYLPSGPRRTSNLPALAAMQTKCDGEYLRASGALDMVLKLYARNSLAPISQRYARAGACDKHLLAQPAVTC